MSSGGGFSNPMKITPLEIQQMRFRLSFRGYARDEVDEFLEGLAKTVESLNRESAELRDRLSAAQQQLADLKKTETTLSNTLVSAQSLGEDMKQAAQRDAELIIKEAELKASEMVREARVELVTLHRDLEDLRKQRLLMIERLRSTVRTFERTLDIEQEEDATHSASAEQAEKIARETNL
jgi:cell division initiation protein